MSEVILCVLVFIVIFVLYLYSSQKRRIHQEQNQLIESLRGEARFLLKTHRLDIELLDWADRSGHFDGRFKSIREELHSAMEKDDAQHDR